jgi:glutathione-specific gamma-glutamylcyclotransferase
MAARRRPMLLTPDLVARAYRPVPDPGPREGRTPIDDADVEAVVARLLAARGGEPLWIFAYGSLIWRPVFAPAEARRARARGWHRAFCIELATWRGTPEVPGLMMALAPGGSCNGLTMRLDPATAAADLAGLVRREMPIREILGNARWITVETAEGVGPALTFWANPVGTRTSHGLPLETVARRLALACGYAGSCAEYLYNTVAHLEAEGIRDRNLWRLQRLVAEEILGWPEASAAE